MQSAGCVCVRAITSDKMTFDREVLGTLVHLDTIQVKFVDQGHRLEFKVTG